MQPPPNDTSVPTNVQSQLDLFAAPIFVPVHKLDDADHFTVQDVNGVTESMFGSGNMNYLGMQAAQTNSVIESHDPFQSGVGAGTSFLANGDDGKDGHGAQSPDASSALSLRGVQSSSIDTDPKLDQGRGSQGTGTHGGEGAPSGQAIGAIGAGHLGTNGDSGFAPNNPAVSNTDGTNIIQGLSGTNGTNGTNGSNGNNGADGQTPNVPTPQDGHDGISVIVDTPVADVHVHLGDTVEHVIDQTMNLIDQALTHLGDTIHTLSTTVNNLSETLVGNLDLADLGDVIQNVTHITENLGGTVSNVVDNITDIAGNITHLLGDLPGDIGQHLADLHLNLNVDLPPVVGVGVDIPLDNPLALTADVNVDITPVGDVIQAVADHVAALPGLEQLGDALGDLGGATAGLQGVIENVTNTLEGTLNNLDHGITPDMVMGTLEQLLQTTSSIPNVIDGALGPVLDGLGLAGDNHGGTDGDLGLLAHVDVLGTNLLGTGIEGVGLDVVLDPVEDLIGDVDLNLGLGLDLLGHAETNNAHGDTDITLGGNVELLGMPVGDLVSGISLDPVEAITGDIDLNLGAATNLLGDVAAGLVNNGAGGTGADTPLSTIGHVLADVVDNILPHTEATPGDTDITITTGIDVVDNTLQTLTAHVNLDPVESLVGDIDLGIDLTANLTDVLNIAHAPDPVAIVPDLLTAVVNTAESVVSNVASVLDNTPLAPVENIVSNINTSVTSGISDAIGLLQNVTSGNQATSAIQNTVGTISTWTETTITGGGGLFGDLANAANTSSNALPEPVTSVAEGLHAVTNSTTNILHKLGGLFH